MMPGAWFRVGLKLRTMPLPLKIFMLVLLVFCAWGMWKERQEDVERAAEGKRAPATRRVLQQRSAPGSTGM